MSDKQDDFDYVQWRHDLLIQRDAMERRVEHIQNAMDSLPIQVRYFPQRTPIIFLTWLWFCAMLFVYGRLIRTCERKAAMCLKIMDVRSVPHDL